ncbi:hypothetical protein J2793_006772 [Paraburkholderia caledonica]|uniref:Stability determinant domain-containing protein n=1 Tax=Paraburkholderia caledonica TaxID=134536 RepID=A0AB73IPJ6_9BURK|nr:hypothetical protein [Paraburkholderia caledonica]
MEETGAYERWLHIKAQTSLGDPRPNISHDHLTADKQTNTRVAAQERRAFYLSICRPRTTFRRGVTVLPARLCALNATLIMNFWRLGEKQE